MIHSRTLSTEHHDIRIAIDVRRKPHSQRITGKPASKTCQTATELVSELNSWLKQKRLRQLLTEPHKMRAPSARNIAESMFSK